MDVLSARPPYAYAPFTDRRDTKVSQTNRRNYLGVSTDSALQHRRDDILPLIRNAFSTVPAYFSNIRAPGDHLEVEMSLGITVDGQFYSRVRQSDWFAAKALCSQAKQRCPVDETVLVDYWYPDVDRFVRDYGLIVRPTLASAHHPRPALRVTTNQTGTVVQCQVKSQCLVQTFNGATLPTPAYDIRVHVNYEQTLDALRQQLSEVPPGWTHKRVKTRHRYCLDGAPEWAIDLTLVHSDDLICEIEVELLLNSTQLAMGTDARDKMAQRGEYALTKLLGTMNVIRGHGREIGPAPAIDVFGNWHHADELTRGRAARLFGRGMGYQDGSARSFSGPMPVELTRERWNALLSDRANVWVAEKTDGVRQALIIDRDLGVCTLDRNGASYCLSAVCPELCQAIGSVCGLTERGATVLDGELVRNESPAARDKHVLVVFDVAMIDGMPCYAMPFQQRQEQMRALVTDRLLPAFQSVLTDKRPFGIRAKRFVELCNFARLHARMDRWKANTNPPERLMHYDDQHQFVTDGLVLVNTTDKRHYKWKPAWKSTVDFFGEPDRTTGQVALSVSGGEDKLIRVGHTTMSRAQLDELARIYIDNELLSRIPPRQTQPRPLFECRYDADSRQWVLVKFRTDKRAPNHFSVLVDALQSLIQPLTLREMIENLA